MAQITAKFRERALLVPQYAANEEMKKMRYHDMLTTDISDFVIFSACQELVDIIARAQEGEQEINLENLRKRKA